MSIPKENRQQMINLMYLVLTALLALNVSAEILNAFKTITRSLESSNKVIDENTKAVFGGFAIKKAKEQANESVTKFEGLATQAMSETKALLDKIATLKKGIIDQAGGPSTEGGIMEKPDDLDVSERYIIGEKRGDQLKADIDAYHKKMISMIDDTTFKSSFETKIVNTNTGFKEGWVTENFGHMPAVAAYTMLTKMETDIKNSEGQMVSYFYSRIGDAKQLERDDIVFDRFSAQITSPSSYILEGETFEANVFLSATSSKSSGTVTVNVNGSNLPVDENGVAHYKAGGGVGEHPVTGTISVRNDRTGEVKPYKLPEFKYTVAAPFAQVSASKTNVLYIGVDNPIEVSAAGMRLQDVTASISSGSLTPAGPGNYIARVTTQGTVNVTPTAKGKSYKPKEFRVKMIPDPIAAVSNQSGGRVNAAWWKAQSGVAALLKDFLFEVGFTVLSYNMFYQPKLQDPGIAATSGAYFSPVQKGFIAKAKPGDIYYIEDIKVKGPDGLSRKIPGIAFKID
ncbi:MAG: gliding motility protein GldM [Chitinophagales bacterium]